VKGRELILDEAERVLSTRTLAEQWFIHPARGLGLSATLSFAIYAIGLPADSKSSGPSRVWRLRAMLVLL
jgi:hypothetical protein